MSSRVQPYPVSLPGGDFDISKESPCTKCFRAVNNPIQCPQCNFSFYCSAECLEADRQRHVVVCETSIDHVRTLNHIISNLDTVAIGGFDLRGNYGYIIIIESSRRFSEQLESNKHDSRFLEHVAQLSLMALPARTRVEFLTILDKVRAAFHGEEAIIQVPTEGKMLSLVFADTGRILTIDLN
jgi:hypothetical protein